MGSTKSLSEKWIVILGEEFGELCEAILNRERDNIRSEAIQVAAVAVAFVEYLDRHNVRNQNT